MVDPAGGPWHLDRRVPITLIVAILFQTAAAIWFAATMAQRVDSLEAKLLATSNQSDRLVRVETIVERIERKLDKISP